jgi:EAL and modified HD-GYP domain-containing signal transduction protein
MNVYVARQPIFNKNKKLYGYELLFRGGTSNAFPDIDGDMATSKLLSNSFLSIGINQLTGGKTAFINFTKELLIKKIPMMFPADNMMVEILEDVEPNEEVVNACLDIFRAGYPIAMDDFVFKNELKPLIKLAHIIKIDFMNSTIEEIRHLVNLLKGYNIKLLAEKIETYDEFERALSMGFTYFQGYFFSKPEILSGKEIVPSKITLLQIVGEVNKKDCNFDKLEKLINRDVSISYKLLRYINSAYFKRVCEISTIKHAIVLLGEKETKRFISLVATAELASEKPDELVRASIIRARLCELLGMNSRNGTDISELFLMGLFSLIDAILDNPMENIMKNLPLSKNIKLALLEGKGALTDYLKLVSYYETANWEKCSLMISKIDANKDKILEFYQDAVNWADSYII